MNIKNPQEYFNSHRENWLDKLLKWVCCRIGVVIHGDMTLTQLEERFKKFDVYKALAEGPYDNNILSSEAQALICDTLHDIDIAIDPHLHNLGYDEGNYVNPVVTGRRVAKWPIYAKFLAIHIAAGISTPEGSTEEARRRLHLYAKHFPKFHGIILPIHKAISQHGEVELSHTVLSLANQAAMKTRDDFENDERSRLFAAVSIHPYSPDWKTQLNEAYNQGVRLVKWLPPQGIKPDAEDLTEFYQAMVDLDMVLIAHSGPEHTIPCRQKCRDWGNPLRFRKALQLGLWVILAHCGHGDLIPDLDNPPKVVPGYELFTRLAKEAQNWPGKLFGDVAGIIGHYDPGFIQKLLEMSCEPGIRIVYGSDHPLPNLVQPGRDPYQVLVKAGLLDKAIASSLKEIRQWNPLFANFALTRALALKTEKGILRFSPSTFTGRFADAELDKKLFIKHPKVAGMYAENG